MAVVNSWWVLRPFRLDMLGLPARLGSEWSELFKSGLELVLEAQSEPDDDELRLVFAP